MLSIIIPAYNEETVIKATIQETAKTLKKNRIPFEIIAVENGSTDNTEKAIDSVLKKGIRKLKLSDNQTFGGAVVEGLKAASGDYLCVTCAGGKVPASEIVRLYKLSLKKKIGYCKGNRGLKYSSKTRVFLSIVYGILARMLFSIKAKDINGYPIIIKRGAYKAIRPQLKNWTLNVELLYKASQHGIEVLEAPIYHRERVAGASHVGIKVVFDMFAGLIKYRIKTWLD